MGDWRRCFCFSYCIGSLSFPFFFGFGCGGGRDVKFRGLQLFYTWFALPLCFSFL
jgi:hypothetical protein